MDLTGKLTDEELFGRWDLANSTWNLKGKMNYDYNADLKKVEHHVKVGNYKEARDELSKYYKNKIVNEAKKAPKKAPKKENVSSLSLDTFCDGIYSVICPICLISVPANEDFILVDLHSYICSKLSQNMRSISFLLMARYKGENLTVFNSREAGVNPPVLEITVDQQVKRYEACSDTYIRAGKYEGDNFGKDKYLCVRDSGYPLDDNNMRSYLQFEMDDLSADSAVTSAVLKLYGKNDSDQEMKLIVFESEQPVVRETEKTWLNSNIKVFSWQGNTESFDWREPNGADNQWLNILMRFWRQMGLIAKYEKIGDAQYLKRFMEMLVSFIDQCGGGELNNEHTISRNQSLNCGFRLHQLTNAFRVLSNSDVMDTDNCIKIIKFFWMEVEYLMSADTFWNSHAGLNNWGMNQTLGQLLVLIHFPEYQDWERWYSEIKKRMDYMVNNFILPDGAYVEATNGYPVSILSHLLFYKDLCEEKGYELPVGFDNKLIAFARFFMNCLEPNWWLTEYGDDHYRSSERLLKMLHTLGQMYDDQELLYAGSKGVEGKAPAQTSLYFPYGKLAVQRTSWDMDALFLFSNVRPYATHCHNDDLHITLHAYGRRLLVDTSDRSYNDEEISNWQRRRRGSHNVVDVDKKSVYVNWSTNTDKLAANGNMLSNTFFDLFSGYHQEEWSENEIMKQHRNVLFIKAAGFWIVSDYASVPPGEHEYYQNWHFDSHADIVIDEQSKKSYSRYTQGSNLLIVPAEANEISSRIENGFIGSNPHKYISYRKQENGDGTYDTILYPFRGTVDKNKIELHRIPLHVPLTTATCFEVSIKEPNHMATGYYYHSYEDTLEIKEFGEFATDAMTVYIQTKCEKLEMLSLYAARYLEHKGKVLMKASKKLDNIGILWDKNRLEISSSGNCIEDKGEITIRVQDTIREVIYNEEKIKYNQEGEYLTF